MVERIILPPIFEFKNRSFVQKIIIMNLLCVRLPRLQSLAFVENRRCGSVFQLIYNNNNNNKRIRTHKSVDGYHRVSCLHILDMRETGSLEAANNDIHESTEWESIRNK